MPVLRPTRWCADAAGAVAVAMWMEDKNMWDFGMSDWDQVTFIGKSLG